jgi:hypothetical protein
VVPLTTKKRDNLPSSVFAGPDRSFPVDTANRARNALARASQYHPELKAKIMAKVHRKFPSIRIEGEPSKERADRPSRRKG